MLILGFGAFLLFGCQLVMIGAYQPQLAAGLGIGLRETGMLGATIVAGIGIGVVSAGPFVDRMSGRLLFAASAIVTAVALLTVGSDMSFARATMHLFFAGFGAGFYETVLNTGVVTRYGEDSVKRLAFVHSAATVGGMLAPLAIVAWVARGGDFVEGFRALGALHVGVAVWGLRGGVFPEPHTITHAGATDVRMRDWATRPAIIALFAASFFYVGGETALTLFVVPYAEEVLGLGADRGRTAISAFWMGLLLMRIIVMLAPRPAGAAMVFWSSSAGTVVLAACLLLRLPAIELVLGSVGLAMGALFPLFVALSGQVVPEARGSAVAVVAGLGAAGGFVLPWGLGIVGDARGPTAVMAGVVVSCAVAAGAGLVLMRAMRPATRT